MIRFLLAVVLILVMLPAAILADSNLHNMVGTMTACGCQDFARNPPGPPCGAPGDPFAPCVDQICFASFEVAAPEPHWDAETPAAMNIEIVEQAIGQCGALNAGLPRKVQALFWLEAGGPDFVHEILYRSPVKAYYLIDLGPAN